MLSQSDKNLIRNAVAWEERFFKTEHLLQEGKVPGVELQPWPDGERYAAGVREEILVGPLHPLNEAGGTVLREDGGGGTGSDDQISQLRLPDGWQEAGTGTYKHREHGTMTTERSGLWRHHAKDGKIIKSGVGQESLNKHLKTLTDDVRPAGDASESQQDLHGRLARAFIGGPEPTTLTEDQRVEVARILSRSGIVMQEATDEQLDRDSLHERLARALRW